MREDVGRSGSGKELLLSNGETHPGEGQEKEGANRRLLSSRVAEPLPFTVSLLLLGSRVPLKALAGVLDDSCDQEWRRLLLSRLRRLPRLPLGAAVDS